MTQNKSQLFSSSCLMTALEASWFFSLGEQFLHPAYYDLAISDWPGTTHI